MESFPLNTWGKVTTAGSSTRVERVCVERVVGGGYLLLIVQNGQTYDTWVATAAEVAEDLAELGVEWPAPPSRT